MKLKNKKLKLNVKILRNEQHQVFMYKKQYFVRQINTILIKKSIVKNGKVKTRTSNCETKGFKKLKKANERAEEKINIL